MAIGRSNVLRYAREGSFNTKSESFSGKINEKNQVRVHRKYSKMRASSQYIAHRSERKNRRQKSIWSPEIMAGD